MKEETLLVIALPFFLNCPLEYFFKGPANVVGHTLKDTLRVSVWELVFGWDFS